MFNNKRGCKFIVSGGNILYSVLTAIPQGKRWPTSGCLESVQISKTVEYREALRLTWLFNTDR